MDMLKRFVAEFAGTLVVIFTGIGVAIAVNTMLSATGMGIPMAFSVGVTALAFGLAITAMYYCFSHISGGHFNPAVSFGLMIAGKLDPVKFVLYIAAQISGAICGAGLIAVIMGTRETLFSSGYDTMSTFGLSLWQAVLVDAVMTFAFVLVYLNVSGKEGFEKPAGIIYGLAFTAVYMIEIPFIGGSSNPAKSIGAAIWQTNGDPLSQVWVFVAAPLLGAAVAAFVYLVMEYEPKAKAETACEKIAEAASGDGEAAVGAQVASGVGEPVEEAADDL